jgi:propanol-preferring alcohol dehydrogenase
MTSYAKSAKQGMRAAVVSAYKTPLKVVNVDKPIPKSGELLVKIKASGCCHTDLHAIDGDWLVHYIN